MNAQAAFTAQTLSADETIAQPDGRRLAKYATDWRQTRGRTHDEPEAPDRSPFQRDRDRIIHADAFRRLQYKTQVYLNLEEGDHFRTRLTHSLEVAQMTRSMCRALAVDEDLGEAVALAHDVGHPPFGHAGEDALNECMAAFGGWRHNEQTLRMLRELECRYGAFDGLNLTWETLEGVAKHNGPMDKHGDGFIPPSAADLEPTTHAGLEAQVAALADDLAYNHHDLDDGLRAGSLHLEQAMSLRAFHRCYTEVVASYPQVDEYRVIKETIRRMIGRVVRDVLRQTRSNLQKTNPQNAAEVRAHGTMLVALSPETAEEMADLKTFLFNNMYRHYLVNRMAYRGHRVIKDLFGVFMAHRRLLPPHVQVKLPADTTDIALKARVVSDYIGTMTDRSALREHARLFSSVPGDVGMADAF